MPEPKGYVELPEEIREKLNSVMQPGEALKIQFGTQGRIIFNESSVGKSQDRLEFNHVEVIKNLLDKTDFKRGPVQAKESTGNQKTPQIEITAVSRDDAGKASIRPLLRQERDLTVSAHPVDLLEVSSPQAENGQDSSTSEGLIQLLSESGIYPPETNSEAVQSVGSITEPDGRLTVEDHPDPLPSKTSSKSFVESLTDIFGASPDDANRVASQHDLLVKEIEDSVAAPEPMSLIVERFSSVLKQTDIHPAAQDSLVPVVEDHFRSVAIKAAEEQRGRAEDSLTIDDFPTTSLKSDEPEPSARPGRSPAPYRIPPEAIPQQNIFTPGSQNTLKALERSVDKLPESKTKALWQRVSADFSAIGDTAKRLGKTVTEVPTAIKADTSTLVGQGKQRVEALRQAVSTRIQQTSPEDVMCAAMKGIGIAAAAGSTQLGKASRYLQNRAEKVRDHGMAKSALAVYEKGHERTGESQFKASSYTVEAVTDGFIVRNSQDRPIMSFGTDAQGRPISVTKTNAATLEDTKALNQLSKADVIKGSPEAERSYENRARVIALTAQAVVKEKGEAINGKHYFMDVRKDGSLQVLTQTMPERSLEMKPDGSIKSTFTQADLNQMETSIKDTRRAIEQPVKPREQMTV